MDYIRKNYGRNYNPAAVAITGGTIAIIDYETLYAEEGLDGASPPGAAEVLTSTNSVVIRKFTAVQTDENLFFSWQPPADLTGGTIVFRPIYFVTNATAPATGETIIFTLEGASLATGEVLGATLGTAVASIYTAVAETALVQYDRIAGPWSAAITITGLSAGETVLLELIRDQTTDTYGQSIGFWAFEIKFTRTLAG